MTLQAEIDGALDEIRALTQIRANTKTSTDMVFACLLYLINSNLGGSGGAASSQYAEGSLATATTSATGANYVGLAAGACRAVDLLNLSSAAIEYRRGGAGDPFPIPAGTSRLITGLTDSDQVSVRRVDNSNTQVVVNFARML